MATGVTPCSNPRSAMSLALGYSSGEDEDLAVTARDAFGLSAIPAKKLRTQESVVQLVPQAAPDVLSEVSKLFFIFFIVFIQYT